MEILEHKPKKHHRLETLSPLPIITKKDGSIYKFKGVFNGFSVIISDIEDQKNMITMGCFGKANLSRSFPRFNNKTEFVRKRQLDKRKEWNLKFKNKKIPKKVIVLPDSDNEEEYLVNLRPAYDLDSSGLKENVHLTLEEAFFLQNAIKCLNIKHDKIEEIDSDLAWSLFSSSEEYFVQNYIAYYYFRSKNWVIKPGIKFGGDYLLYKQGPAYFHASYVVIIETLNEDLTRHCKNRRSMVITELTGLQRLCETAGKELLICQLILPRNVDITYKNLGDVRVKEVLMKRWIASQERQTIQ